MGPGMTILEIPCFENGMYSQYLSNILSNDDPTQKDRGLTLTQILLLYSKCKTNQR